MNNLTIASFCQASRTATCASPPSLETGIITYIAPISVTVVIVVYLLFDSNKKANRSDYFPTEFSFLVLAHNCAGKTFRMFVILFFLVWAFGEYVCSKKYDISDVPTTWFSLWAFLSLFQVAFTDAKGPSAKFHVISTFFYAFTVSLYGLVFGPPYCKTTFAIASVAIVVYVTVKGYVTCKYEWSSSFSLYEESLQTTIGDIFSEPKLDATDEKMTVRSEPVGMRTICDTIKRAFWITKTGNWVHPYTGIAFKTCAVIQWGIIVLLTLPINEMFKFRIQQWHCGDVYKE